jgi:hypothetical protein
MARKQFSVNIDKKDIDNIIQTITEQEIKQLDNNIQQDNLQLKLIAAKFLKVALNTQEKIQKIENMMFNQQKIRKQIKKDLGITGRLLPQHETENYIKNREELQNELKNKEIENLYNAAFTFHEDINRILGQEVQTIIVLEDKEGNPLLFSLSKEEIFNNNILSFEETSKTARLTARFRTSAQQMKNAGISAIQRDDFNDDLNINNLNKSYKDIIYRYDTYKQIVLWMYPMGTWNKSKVSARGDIAEAYAMFFLKKVQYNFQSNNSEENIHYFMTLGVANVDNVSGLLQGDVSNKQYEYAIKSANASYMSIIQMITLAQDIVNKNKYGLSDLQKKKDTLAQKKQKIRNPITQITEEKIDKIFSDLVQDINSQLH